MARKYVVVSVGPSPRDKQIQSTCQEVVELADGRKFLGRTRTYLDGAREIGDVVLLEQTIVK